MSSKIDYMGSVFHTPYQEKKKQIRLKLYQEMRENMSCCCSRSCHEKINELLDELERRENESLRRTL